MHHHQPGCLIGGPAGSGRQPDGESGGGRSLFFRPAQQGLNVEHLGKQRCMSHRRWGRLLQPGTLWKPPLDHIRWLYWVSQGASCGPAFLKHSYQGKEVNPTPCLALLERAWQTSPSEVSIMGESNKWIFFSWAPVIILLLPSMSSSIVLSYLLAVWLHTPSWSLELMGGCPPILWPLSFGCPPWPLAFPDSQVPGLPVQSSLATASLSLSFLLTDPSISQDPLQKKKKKKRPSPAACFLLQSNFPIQAFRVAQW